MFLTNSRSSKASGNAGDAGADGPQVQGFTIPGYDIGNASPVSGSSGNGQGAAISGSAAAPESTGSGSPPSWIGSLQDAVIRGDMTAASSGGTVTEAGMAKLFTDLAAELKAGNTTLSASQSSDLQTIASNLNVGETASAYVTYITDALILGNPANANFTGGAANPVSLGNLATGATATQVLDLADKWFLGTDLPSDTVKMDGVRTFTITYSADNLPLYGSGGPAVGDINQGYLGDCYLEASLLELVYQNPSMIGSMITSNGNNTYGVRFFVNGGPEYVTVSNMLADGGTEFNYSGNGIWASLVEQAYAQIQAGGDITGNGSAYYNDGNSFSTIGNGGYEENALEEITGATQVTDFNGSGSSWTEDLYSNTSDYTSSLNLLSETQGLSSASVVSAIVSALAAGDDLVLGSNTNAYDSKGYYTLVSDHAFAIYGYDSSTGELELDNPWGTTTQGQNWDTTFEVSLSTLLADGDTVSIDNAGTTKGPAPTVAIIAAGLQSDQTTVSLSGTIDAADAGLTISIYDGGTSLLGSTTANSSGAWSTTVTVSSTGVHTLTAQATNLGGTGVSNSVVDLVSASTSLSGGGQFVLFSGSGDAVTLSNTAGAPDSVTGSGGTITLNSAQVLVTGSDSLIMGTGNNAVTASGGSDTAIFSGARSASTVSHNAAGDIVTNISTGAADTLTGVQSLQFANETIPWYYQPANDFSGDGTSDILFYNASTSQVGEWLLQNGQLSSAQALATLGTGSGWSAAGSGDFNGDGTSDILFYNSGTGTLGEWLMQNGNIGSSQAVGSFGAGSGWTVAGTGDFNGDGTSDILFYNSNSGTVGEWLMHNGQIASSQAIASFGAGSGWSIAGTGDFTGNGTDDILFYNASTGTLGEWLMQNGQLASSQAIGSFGAGSGWSIAGVGDFTGNGTDDILFYNANTGIVGEWLMQNGQLASSQAIGSLGVGSGWTVAGVGDYTGNGTSDILFYNTSTGAAGEWLMQNGQLSQAVGLPNAGTSWHPLKT